MSENTALYGLLADAMDRHVTRGDVDAYEGVFTDFTLDVDVIVRPPFDRYRLQGGKWDGTTGTRKYMLPYGGVYGPRVVDARGVDTFDHHTDAEHVYPYRVVNGTPAIKNTDDGVSYAFHACSFFFEGDTTVTTLTLYDLLALVAAQDVRDAGVAQTLRESVINYPGTCGLSVDEREDLLGRFLDKRGAYYRRKSHNIPTTRQVALIDPLTNAITDSGKGGITPADYFTEESREIDTGNGGVALLDIRASDDADIDDISTYVADNQTRFWLDHLYPLVLDAAENDYEVHGSELLIHAGYKNPYDRGHEQVMRNAAENIDKALKTRIAIDVTREKRNKRGKNKTLIESIELRPIVDGIMTIDRYEEDGEEVRDFTVTVKPRVGEGVIDALPLAKYAESRGMLTNYSQDEITFSGIRQTLDDRRMWAYVLRRIKSKGMSGTIRFETMWNDLKVDEGASKESKRKKRNRMLGKLEKMLDQKKGDLFSSWTWKKDADGRVYGIQIRRKSTRNSSKKN